MLFGVCVTGRVEGRPPETVGRVYLFPPLSSGGASIAHALIDETCQKHGIARDALTLHSDCGSPMRAKTTTELLVDLGVAASFSRPRVSNDNPFSEAQFKTLKYRPEFPARFESLEHARAHLRTFFAWYNDEHRHSGIRFMTPAAIHALRHRARALAQPCPSPAGSLCSASRALQGKDPDTTRTAYGRRHQPAEHPTPGDDQ